MKILLLVPFLLGNSAGGSSALLEGLLALGVVFGIFGFFCWGTVRLWKNRK